MYRAKISVLWLFAVVAWLGYLILKLMEPGVIETILSSGEYEGMKLGPEILLAYAFVLLVLLVMAFLSLTLKYSINRWANIIVGIVVTVVDLGGLIELLPQAFCLCDTDLGFEGCGWSLNRLVRVQVAQRENITSQVQLFFSSFQASVESVTSNGKASAPASKSRKVCLMVVSVLQ